jgi:hypothetical protein
MSAGPTPDRFLVGLAVLGLLSAVYGLNLTVPAAEAPALAAITKQSFYSQDPVAISTAGQTWDVTMTAGPLTNGEFGMWVQSKSQLLRLQRQLMPPA